VAAAGGGGTFHLEFNSEDKTGPISMPNTGGWRSGQTLTKTDLSLSAGQHIMKIVFDTNGSVGAIGNINYLTFY
jgi:hypothetical protein